MRRLMRWVYWSFIFGSAAGISAALGGLAVVVWQVEFGDIEGLKKTTILSKLQEETRIYYNDENTQMGSLFESRHRRYVPITEIPPHMQNAIVAAEDKNFYEHVGVDPIAIINAVAGGLAKGGRFRGASTITQQTVKNLLDDWEMSLTRKIREAIRALQLEKLYDKKQILEFYLNQFHVAGNGNGIGIAARYYFDKEVKELTLVEAAFIAGSVKGPSKYNPFIKFTKKAKERAKHFANQRKNYVLGRMFEHQWIDEEEYKEAVQTDVPFKRGEFRTAEVTLVDLVSSQLKKKEILDALNLDSADQLNIAGYNVFTTIDHDLQNAAQLVMRRNLSRLETILQGFAPEPKNNYKTLASVDPEEFHYGKVVKKNGTSIDDFSIDISFGLPEATIPNASLVRYAKLLDLPVGHRKGYKHHLEELRKTIKVGDVLYLEVKSYNKETHRAEVELHKRPKVSGGMIALDKGQVRAVISGFDTVGFNRAMHAKRQPGSVFKSLVYFAALQLGWSILDTIDNERQIFAYQGKFYYPRPDHASAYKDVSMLWAGTLSENLASVSLAANLLDKLSFEQFKKLMSFMDLSPQQDESARDFHYRVGRTIGVQLSNSGIRAMQLRNAVEDLAPDLVFDGQSDTLRKLRKMWWGEGYAEELQVLFEADPKKFPRKEMATRTSLLRNNFLRMQLLSNRLNTDWNLISNAVSEKGASEVLANPILQEVISRFRVLNATGSRPELSYEVYDLEEEQPKEGIEPIPGTDGIPLVGRELNPLDVQAIWGDTSSWFDNAGPAVNITDVRLGGFLPMGTFVRLQKDIEDRYLEVTEGDSGYRMLSYYHHHDFRIALGLNYLVKLCKAAGVFSKLEPVLSFPLGTNDVSASEVAKLYQTFISGKTYRFFEKGPENQITFIKRIEDRFGNVLYEPEIIEHSLANRAQSLQMREILQKVVTHGTARARARGELYVTLEEGAEKGKANKIRIPAFGKTGTTNDFTTSYFAGFMPYPTKFGQPLDPENSYVISTYVGYDQPKEMKRGRQRIYGGTGALPAWTNFAKEIIKLQDYKSKIDPFDLQVISKKEWPLSVEEGVNGKLVDLPRGLVIRGGNSSDFEMWDTTDIATDGEDFFNPFALGSSVQSLVTIHTDHRSRSFRPFTAFEADSMGAEPVAVKKRVMDTSRVRKSRVGEVSLRSPSENTQNSRSQPQDGEDTAPANNNRANEPESSGDSEEDLW